jgi:rubredoxin
LEDAEEAADTPTAREPKGRPRLKTKAKWSDLKGEDRCTECLAKELKSCQVEELMILKWEADVAAGKKFTRTPAGGTCKECRLTKRRCILPCTKALRALLGDAKGKRKREEGGLEGGEGDSEDEGPPVAKKSRTEGKVGQLGEPLYEVLDVCLRLLAAISRDLKHRQLYEERLIDVLERIADRLDS